MPTRIKWHGIEAIWNADAAIWETPEVPVLGLGLTEEGKSYDRAQYVPHMGNTQAIHLQDTLGVEILEQEGPDPDDKPGTIY
jgi:hypothetical protein